MAMISRAARTLQVLHKVVGVSDLYAWAIGGRVFQEISPLTIKAAVAGDKNAHKDVVASSLERFVGPDEYACDDESDAVAVGVTWLLKHGLIDDPLAKPKRKRKTE